MADNIREIILDTLLAMERGEQFSNRLMKSVLDKYDYLDTRDKSFMKRVTEGCVERRLELDYYLDTFSKVPVKKMKPFIRCLMRMSVYQLLYMDNVPDSAVCNEACKLAVKHKFGTLKGFVNGVLRSIARQKDNLPMPDRATEPCKYLSVRYSCPEWLVQFFADCYGGEITEDLLEGLLKVHPVSLRLRSNLTEQERTKLLEQLQQSGTELQANPYLPYLYLMKNSDNISSLPGFSEGLWTVQDVSSALAVEAAEIQASDIVIDACAAPGGKSMLAAEKARKVLSRDVSEDKVAYIEENIQRMDAADKVVVQVWDATVPDQASLEQCDVLILDVPCSGLGIMGKKRDIKYRVTPEHLKELEQLQKQIVNTCAPYVKPGGTLLYSTCTINPAENEAMVRYITNELGYLPICLDDRIPERLLNEKKQISALRKAAQKEEKLLSEEEKACCIQLLPGYMESDGFFFAVFRRPEA